MVPYIRSQSQHGASWTSDAERQRAMGLSKMSTNTLATGFEPQRHTMMVCGRPVQVHLLARTRS